MSMKERFIRRALAVALAVGFAAGLATGLAAAQTPAKKYTPPRNADGHPDFSGVWSSATITPLERPAELAGKATFTPEEAAAYEKATLERNNADRRDGGAAADVGRAYNDAWYDRGTKVVGTRRTSLIVDPTDGRVPPLTPEAQKLQQQLRDYGRQHPADGPEDRILAERCIIWPTAGPPMMPSFYNNNYQIVQAPGYVAIEVEMIHDMRMIPTDGRPHLPSSVRQWMGDSRGQWEGDTLVVETTNFTDKTRFRGATENMKLTERFTRVGPDSLAYEFTVNDPAAFTKPWTASIVWTKSDAGLYEYACSEGNYAMTGMLAGARAAERTAEKDAEKAAAGK
jgi:hypothetical protein